MDYVNEAFTLTVFPNHLKTVLDTYIAMRDYVAKLAPVTKTVGDTVYLQFRCIDAQTEEDLEDFKDWTIHENMDAGVEHINQIIQAQAVKRNGHWILDDPLGYGLKISMPGWSDDLPGEMDVLDIDLVITPWYPETNS